MTTVKIMGDEVFYSSITKMSLAIRLEVNNEMVVMGTEIRNNILNSMRNTKKRTTNPVKGHRVAPHYPSLPGYAPAVDRGRLINDIKMRSSKIGSGSIEVEVGDVSQKYGKWLEEGTPRLKARPWLEPAYASIPFEERIGFIIAGNTAL